MKFYAACYAILMPLQTERDLCLALSAEANDLVQVLIRLRIHSMRRRVAGSS